MPKRLLILSSLAGWLVCAAACRTVPPMVPANLSVPGWIVRHGQAVWHRPGGVPELAGEILVATRPDQRSFVQFSKNGFPLLVAQTEAGAWEIQIPAQDKRYSGRGTPPKRMLAFYLPIALAGERLPPGWLWQISAAGEWRLSNGSAGESLEGYFDP